jgi:hypothetical protein
MSISILDEKLYGLCLEIEKLPASPQQTKCSVLAAEIRRQLKNEVWINDAWEMYKMALQCRCGSTGKAPVS